MKKKLVELIMCLTLVFALISPVMVNAADYSASRIVSYVNGRVGESYARGYCLRFVDESFQNIYGFREYSCCAYKCGSTYLDSASRDIPLGACVFFGGSDVTCSCGNRAGHIGIYVGNGNIVHAWAGKLVNTSIDYVVSCGYPYRGWGWLCDVALTTDNPNPPNNPRLQIYDKYVPAGATICFEYSCNNADRMYIAIDVDGVREHFIEVSGDHYNGTFTKSGHYAAALYAYNSAGESGYSNWVEFDVYNTAPSNCKIQCDKTTIYAGESVNFSVSAKYATEYQLGMFYNGNRIWLASEKEYFTSKSVVFQNAGEYVVYVSSYNGFGYCDSDKIKITVKEKVTTTPTPSSDFTVQKYTDYANITNNTSEYQEPSVIFAKYNNGVLADTEIYGAHIPAGETLKINTSFGSDYKVFVWDSLNGMKPLCESE